MGMNFVELLLLIALFLTCVYASVTDIKLGIIPNKLLVFSGFSCAFLNLIYYIFFAKEYFLTFIINFIILVILSVAMYGFNLWAAGDSKLLFVVVLAIPARLYDTNIGIAPAIFIIVFTFAISFIYIVVESIWLRIKNRDKIHLPSIGTILQFLKNYLYISVYITVINYLILYFFPDFASRNASLISICWLFFAIIIYKYPLFFRRNVMFCVLTFGLIILWLYNRNYGFDMPNINLYLYVVIILFFRFTSEKYNYLIIPTSEVKSGMILSSATIMIMNASRVKGLPKTTTEDMRSRISQDEADSIIHWEHTKYGMSEITIVRKIPFAIFITFGVLVFLLLRLDMI